MRLDQLTLENVCQHRTLNWDFGRGVIGILGPNGSGKSNALNVACYGALTGDWSRHAQGKNGMIRQQAAEDEKSYIRLQFTHDGEQFEITRGFRGTAAHRMVSLSSGDHWTKANEIQSVLEEVLGIQRRLIDEFMFCDQWQLFAFLSAVPAERARSFAYLCNTVKAEKIWELLGAQVQTDTPLAERIVDSRDEVRVQLGEYKQRHKIAEQRMVEARTGLLSKPRKEECDWIVQHRSTWDFVERRLGQLRSDEALLKTAAAKAYAELKQAKAELEELAKDADADAVRWDEITAALSTLQDQQKAWNLKSRWISEHARLAGQLAVHTECELLSPAVDVNELQEERRQVQSEYERLEELLDNVDGQPACPTCGTPSDKLQDHINDAKRRRPELRQRLDELQQRIDDAQSYAQSYAEWVAKRNQLQAKLDDATDTLTSLEGISEPSALRLTELTAEQGQIRQRRKTRDTARTTVALKEQAFAGAKGRHQATKQQREELEQDQIKHEVSDEDLARAREELDRHTAANVQIVAAKAAIAELDGFITNQQKELERITLLLQRSAKARHWVQLLTQCRDEVMHRDKLPRIVHQSYLEDMTDEINTTLDLLGSPFHVTTTADISFVAHFSNGTTMPAEGLSGGQKVLLAMAYRLTVNSLFAPQVGCMVLDEPTVALDADNREMIAEVFRNVGAVARSRGQQIIIITHEESLRSCFDQTFVLEQVA